MFTGIIRNIGTVWRIQREVPWKVTIKAHSVVPLLTRGASICVSGACLTVIECKEDTFTAELSQETLQRTTFQRLQLMEKVNLEPAMILSDRLDGHIVQGHIDGMGKITRVSGSKEKTYVIKPDKDAGSLIVEKGSIAVDGISLTISELFQSGEFSVIVIPLTLSDTTLSEKKSGDKINLEYDILGKYIARYFKL